MRHLFVIHDDGSLSKILIARCFPVAFGPPVANVSDPSGLDCVDLPVANLGDPSAVRTGQLGAAVGAAAFQGHTSWHTSHPYT